MTLSVLPLVLLIVLSGCATKQPAVTEVDQNLPTVTGIKHITDMNSIGFEWNTVTDSNIAGYIIYRSNPQREDNKLDQHVKIDNKYSNHYVDTDLTPNTTYRYRFAVYSDEGTRSEASETITLQTTPMLDSVSFIQSVNVLPRQAKIIWRPHSSRSVKNYIVERKDSSSEWREIAKVPNRLSAEYIDMGLDDNTVYQYRVRVELFNGLISAPSEVVKATTKPLPPQVQNITASDDKPRAIVLEWDPVELDDFSHYKVYRKRLFWSYHAKVDRTRFVDEFEDDGISREYKVTAVDKDGLESIDSEVVKGNTLHKPKAPKIDLVRMDEKSIYIQWRPKDDRAQNYILIKNGERVANNITNTVYTDTEVEPGKEYRYAVISEDKYGLMSHRSDEASIFLPLIVER